ncbi:hypothetical protein ADEAN_000424200 [Angomonas deanei]|uniref:Uncharacterized protein n=1 Tax=Angomonas deanei TaxID=59799 RepID=A0A7G2CB85_9TRYP|nr:hypothetical protein ADEAN_000424200 [Angomonas deanei]
MSETTVEQPSEFTLELQDAIEEELNLASPSSPSHQEEPVAVLGATDPLFEEALAEKDDAAMEIEGRWGNFEALPEETTVPHKEAKEEGKKRRREAKTEKAERELQTNAYKHSQKRLRKEAKNLCLKDLIAKSISHGKEDYSSPVVASPNTPASPWSPRLAGEITNRFLSNVKNQQKQTFQKIMNKELGNSQSMTTSRSQHYVRKLHETEKSQQGSTAVMDVAELVIEEETVEEKEVTDFDFVSGDSRTASFNFDSERIPSYVGESDQSTAADREKEKAEIRALTRKHEIWKLKQRQMKSNALLQSTQPKSVTAASPVVMTTPEPSGRPSDSLPLTLKATLENRTFSTPTIKETKLTVDDISMIRRINSFDNISNKRVVVFETSAKENSNSKSTM